MTPQLPQEEIERIEANAIKAFPITDTSTFSGIMQDAYLAGAIHEAERGREMAAGFAEWIEENGYSIANRNDGPIWSKGHDWPTTVYTTAELLDIYLSERAKK